MTKTPGDIILLHFCTTNEDHMMYSSWDIRQDRVFCHSGPFFALWPTPKHSENQNFEKLKKPLGDITILHMCPSNDNHMMYCSWDMECDRQYFVMADYFLHFHHPNNPWKSKFWNNEKNSMRYYYFTHVQHKWKS